MIVLALFMLTACGEETSTSTNQGGYIGGTDGLTIGFSAEAPPESVLDNNQEVFDINLEITNEGEHNVQAGEVMVTLTGINPVAYNVATPTQRNLVMIGAKTTAADGTILEGDVSTDINYLASYQNDLPVDQPETIVADVCYRYQTSAVSDVCLRRDVTAKGEVSDVCEVKGSLSVSNSAGPMQITQMTQNIAGKNEVLVTIKLESSGEGIIYAPEAILEPRCSETGTQLKAYKNKVHVLVESGTPNAPVKCPKFSDTNSGYVNIVSGTGAGSLTCVIDTSQVSENTFPTKAAVTLGYVYRDSISQEILIQNVL